MNAQNSLEGTRKKKGIWVKEYTLWTKTEIAVLAYFKKNNNQPTTYREIARAYVKSNYTDYKKACDELAKRGKLEKLKDGSFKVHKNFWTQVKRGTEIVERSLPYLDYFLRKLKQRKRP